MPRLLGRKHTAINDLKVTAGTHGFQIVAPVQCIVEKQIDRKKIVIFGSSRTISVAFDVNLERVEECMSLKSPLVQQTNEGGNIYLVIRTSKVKEQCSGSSPHFRRGFLNGKSLRFVGGVGTLRNLIYSLIEGPHAHRAFSVLRNPWKATAIIVSINPCMRFLRPITGLLHGSEEDSHSLPGRDWSSLPFLLLWIITNKLDFFSNAKVALVCRHWWHGSRNNPTKMQTVGDGIPWIMLNASERGNMCVREFINFERTKKFAVELPEFYNSRALFSRRGWILLRRKKVCTREQIIDSFFLINPLTKGKIELGDMVIHIKGSCDVDYSVGCFSTNQDGFPNCVVIFYKRYDVDKISLYITYPGRDQVWTKHSYAVNFNVHNSGMTVLNSLVYFFCDGGVMITYDMGAQTWKEIAPPLPQSVVPMLRFMEREGNVGLFGLYGYYVERWLYKYSHTHNCWQRLANDDDEANNLSIFGCRAGLNRTYFTVRTQRGVNVHEISPSGHGTYLLCNHDYLSFDKSTCRNLHDEESCWVDIG